ncbi:putative membrane protein YkvI [Microbacterium sp. SORGH_AS 862]|nr:putative membrane protein YkvI [Microbacterium sp. SORGH_AS_0862]
MNTPRSTGRPLGALTLSLVMAGTMVGVAFSTGREVMTYFGEFGPAGIVGMILAFAAIGACIPIAVSVSRMMNATTFDWVVTPVGWRPLRMFNLALTIVSVFSSLSALLAAAAGTILQALFGLPLAVGATTRPRRGWPRVSPPHCPS